MPWPDSSQNFGRHPRGRRRGRWELEAWEAGEEEEAEGEQQEEAWARPPSPRRGRWERPGPAGWRPEEPEAEALAPRSRRRSPSPRASWAGRSRSRSPGAPRESRAWGSPPGEDAESLEEPGRQRGLRPTRGRWSSAKRTGRGRPRLFNPEAPSRQRQRSPDGDARAWGSPGRERASESTDRDRAWGSPGRELSWKSPGRERAWKSPNRERASESTDRERPWGSPGTARAWKSPGRERAWKSPNRERASESTDRERPWGSPGRERAWKSPNRERASESTDRERPWGSPGRERAWKSPNRERASESTDRERPWGSPGRERAWKRPGRERALGSSDREHAWKSLDKEQAWKSPGRERTWERARNTERPVWGEPRQESPGGAGGRRWASTEGRKEPSQSPSRERRSLGSSGRDVRQEGRGSFSGWNQTSGEPRVGSSDGASGRWGRTERRGREHWSPTRKQSGVGSPQREAREERWRNTRHHAREQSPVSPEEAGSREGTYLNRSRDEGSSFSFPGGWQSPNGEGRGQGSPRRHRGAENPDEEGAETNSYKWGGEEKRMDVAGRNSPEASAPFTGLIAASSEAPKEWTPRESVVRWWTMCRGTLQKSMREQLMSLCPRPTLPDRSSETPQINPQILPLLNRNQGRGIRGVTHFNVLLQEEVLDLLAPAMTIYEMAEEAMEKDVPVDPMELREWSRHLLRFIGSINNRLTFQHRTQVLGCINPQLRMLAKKLTGKSTEGMLFAEDKVKLLKEILKRFPQLTRTSREMPKKNFYSYTGAASYKLAQRRLLGSRYRPVGPGNRGTAGQEVEQSHSQGAREEDPAEWH